MQAELEALRRDQERMMLLVGDLSEEIRHMAKQFSEARGGWRMLLLIGGGAAAAGGTVVAAAQKAFKVLG